MKKLLWTITIILISSTAHAGCSGWKPYKPTSYCPAGWVLICEDSGYWGEYRWVCVR